MQPKTFVKLCYTYSNMKKGETYNIVMKSVSNVDIKTCIQKNVVDLTMSTKNNLKKVINTRFGTLMLNKNMDKKL